MFDEKEIKRITVDYITTLYEGKALGVVSEDYIEFDDEEM